jgi:hypothetical protein
MRPGRKGALPVALLLFLAIVGAGCGSDAGKEADEGVPLQLGELEVNVQETRFLNPAQPDDKEYLQGQELPVPPSKTYLGVFLTMHNKGDDTIKVPSAGQLSVVDTTGTAYPAVPSSTAFAAPLGAPLAGGGDIPVPDTAAANGPTGGALVLFLMNEAVTENRPLKLEIDYAGETGEITLDI